VREKIHLVCVENPPRVREKIHHMYVSCFIISITELFQNFPSKLFCFLFSGQAPSSQENMRV